MKIIFVFINMGFKQEYFDEKIFGEFICFYCYDVFLEFVVLGCQYMLCVKCYKKRMKWKVFVCFICKKVLCLSDEKIDIKWKEQYESLEINCFKGCEKVLLFGNFNDYFVNYCQLIFMFCINIGCVWKV